MRGSMSYILAGIVVVATMDAIAPPVGLGLAIAKWPAVDRNTAVQVIDRSTKVIVCMYRWQPADRISTERAGAVDWVRTGL